MRFLKTENRLSETILCWPVLAGHNSRLFPTEPIVPDGFVILVPRVQELFMATNIALSEIHDVAMAGMMIVGVEVGLVIDLPAFTLLAPMSVLDPDQEEPDQEKGNYQELHPEKQRDRRNQNNDARSYEQLPTIRSSHFQTP